jgi:glycosyltransferase involved in cell wall biosynthesis
MGSTLVRSGVRWYVIAGIVASAHEDPRSGTWPSTRLAFVSISPGLERDGPLVSIVTPSLNRADLIEPTIRSVRSQSYRNIEHIVIDGESTDETLTVLERYRDSYPLRWISEADTGMYSAINKGLALAQGEILAYLNTDDLYFPWTIEVVVDAFRRHPEVDVVFGDVIDIDDATGWQKFAWGLPFDLDYLRRSGYMWQPAVFWRRRVLEREGGFDESLRFVADLEYWLRLGGDSHRFKKIFEFLAIARYHPATLSLMHRPKVIRELDSIRLRHAPRGRAALPLWNWLDRLRRPFWTRIFWLCFVAQSVVPARFRRGPWSRLLASGQTRLSYVSLVLRPIPGLGRKVAGPLIRPSHYWLRPP